MNWAQKAVSLLGLEGLFGEPSRQDGSNFRTNMVTLAEYQDGNASGSAAVLGLAAAWACVNLLSGTIASLPLDVYRTPRDGSRSIATDHPLYRLLHDSPNADQTALDFWEFICACLEMHGNSFCEIVRGSDGRVISLLPPIVPEIMSVKRNSGGELQYEWADGQSRRSEPQSKIFHIRGFGGSPMGGLSTLAFGRQAFGMARSINQAAQATFRNGVRTSGVMASDKPFTPEQRKTAEGLLQEKYAGAMNAGVPMLLDNGLKWQSISINPEDAQMLESRAFSVEEICRFFGVPPHMVGHTQPRSARFEPVPDLRGFHRWFLHTYTFPSCLPNPARLAVPDRPGVDGAAPTLTCVTRIRLLPAFNDLLRQAVSGSFHPTRSVGASWRTGGSKYNPTTSINFSSKYGSLDSLNVRTKCGLSPRADHTRCTVSLDTPTFAAIVRHDQ